DRVHILLPPDRVFLEEPCRGRAHRRRVDDVDANAELAPLARRRARQRADAFLAGAVDGVAGLAVDALARAEVDYGAAALLEVRERRLHVVERAEQPRAERQFDRLVGDVLDQRLPGRLRIVDQDVDAAELVGSGGDRAVGVLALGHVGLNADNFRAARINFAGI